MMGAGDRRELSINDPVLIQLQGIPLHLCVKQNLEAIGNRLGKLESIDTVDGRIKVAMDSTNPLKFTRKLQTRKMEDITIKLFYEKLFKHCSTCGLMTHEAQDCLAKPNTFLLWLHLVRMCLIEYVKTYR